MSDYERGDRVWWWSDVGGKAKRTKAVYVRDDGSKDVILLIPIGKYRHQFRWPLRFTEPV